MNRNLSKAELELQLACLHCGIIWEGTPQQVRDSQTVDREIRDSKSGSSFELLNPPSTIEIQLNSMSAKEARVAKRRFRKLWRQGAKRAGLLPECVAGCRNSRRHFAYEEALRIYRSLQVVSA